MGSGLILLVIVAAWLAVLVPMALRSHESSTSLSSVDRFSDAMRVLSRRDAAARARARREADDDPLSAQAWAENDTWDVDWDDGVEHPAWRERVARWRAQGGSGLASREGRGPSSPAARRRRLLLTLVGLTVLFSVAGLVGPRVLLGVAGVLAVAVVLFVVQLRRLAVARASRAWRAPARRTAPASQPARTGSVRVRPVDVPAAREPEVVRPAAELFDQAAFEPVASPAVRHDEPVPAAGSAPEPARLPAPAAALGEAWSPVPIPPPTYVTAAVAPARARRVVDLTRPGAWSQQEGSRPAEQPPGTASPAAPAAERRRAVNEW